MTVTEDAPAIVVEANLALPASRRTVTVAAFEPTATLGVPALIRVSRSLLEPDDAATVPVLAPVFAIEVRVVEGTLTNIGVDVQVADDTAFTTPVTLSRDNVGLLVGDNVVRVPTLVDLTDTVPYFWRARLRFGGLTMAWTAFRTFTPDLSAGEHTVAVLATVTTGATDPHLWHVTPTVAVPGDVVTIVGQGFAADEGTAHLGGAAMTVLAWTHVAATTNATTAERVITATVTDPEHDEVSVVVPDVAPPGGALTVEGT